MGRVLSAAVSWATDLVDGDGNTSRSKRARLRLVACAMVENRNFRPPRTRASILLAVEARASRDDHVTFVYTESMSSGSDELGKAIEGDDAERVAALLSNAEVRAV